MLDKVQISYNNMTKDFLPNGNIHKVIFKQNITQFHHKKYTTVPDPPIEREKNACPKAYTHVFTFFSESHCGTNKYLYPRTESGRNTLSFGMKHI